MGMRVDCTAGGTRVVCVLTRLCKNVNGVVLMSNETQNFADYPTVQKYQRDLADNDFNLAEQQTRLATLEAFCKFVERTPEQMVAEIFDPVTHKYKKRNFYTGKVKEFQTQVQGTWHQQTARGNVVRAFFIANGRRLPNEEPDWL